MYSALKLAWYLVVCLVVNVHTATRAMWAGFQESHESFLLKVVLFPVWLFFLVFRIILLELFTLGLFIFCNKYVHLGYCSFCVLDDAGGPVLYHKVEALISINPNSAATVSAGGKTFVMSDLINYQSHV